MGAVNIIELLARSEHRVRILDLLCEHGSLDKHALGEQLDASRTTVGRNLDALEEQGWIRRTNSHCSITRQGELVVEPDIADLYRSSPEYAELWGEMEETGRLELFAHEGTLPYSLGVFDDTVQIIVAEGDDPRALLETTSETVREWALEQYHDYKRHADGFSVS